MLVDDRPHFAWPGSSELAERLHQKLGLVERRQHVEAVRA
jgi:hypothetical protein